jgi:Methyltransferase domain
MGGDGYDSNEVCFCFLSFCFLSFCLLSSLLSFRFLSFCFLSFCFLSFCFLSFCFLSFCCLFLLSLFFVFSLFAFSLFAFSLFVFSLFAFSLFVFSLFVFSLFVFSLFVFSLFFFSLFFFSLFFFSLFVFSLFVFSLFVFSLFVFSLFVFSLFVFSLFFSLFPLFSPHFLLFRFSFRYEDGSFDVVLDKGALDALVSEDTESVRDDAQRMFCEIARVLRPKGRYMCVTLAQEHVLSRLLTFFGQIGWNLRITRLAATPDSPLCPFFVIATSVKEGGDVVEISDDKYPFLFVLFLVHFTIKFLNNSVP